MGLSSSFLTRLPSDTVFQVLDFWDPGYAWYHRWCTDGVVHHSKRHFLHLVKKDCPLMVRSLISQIPKLPLEEGKILSMILGLSSRCEKVFDDLEVTLDDRLSEIFTPLRKFSLMTPELDAPQNTLILRGLLT